MTYSILFFVHRTLSVWSFFAASFREAVVIFRSAALTHGENHAAECRNTQPLILAAVMFLIGTGCGSSESPDVDNDPHRTASDPIPIYIVDDFSEQIHSASGSLSNPTDFTIAYIYQGASCGCTSAEHDGKLLHVGDKIEVAPKGVEEITLRSRIAYREGFYSDSALFQSIAQPPHQVVIETPYGVIKSLRASRGALVFERNTLHGSFEASVIIKFRYADWNRNSLNVLNVPEPIEWRVTQQSISIESRQSTATDRYYEDEWIVDFSIRPDVRLGAALQPHGEIDFVVANAQKEQLASKSLPYNAGRLNKPL